MTELPIDVVVFPIDVAVFPNGVAVFSGDLVEFSRDVAEFFSDVAEFPKDVAEFPEDVAASSVAGLKGSVCLRPTSMIRGMCITSSLLRLPMMFLRERGRVKLQRQHPRIYLIAF